MKLYTLIGISALALTACGENHVDLNSKPGGASHPIVDGNSLFDPNALKYAYWGFHASIHSSLTPDQNGSYGSSSTTLAVIISADPNLCAMRTFDPVEEGSVDLSGVIQCSSETDPPNADGVTECPNIMKMKVGTHPASGAPGQCSMYGDKADGSASIKGLGTLTYTEPSSEFFQPNIRLVGSVFAPSHPNTPIPFDYALPARFCSFPLPGTANGNDTISCY